jgi:hypothetical protein
MGHADLQILRQHLTQTTEDIAQAYRIESPVDNARLYTKIYSLYSILRYIKKH